MDHLIDTLNTSTFSETLLQPFIESAVKTAHKDAKLFLWTLTPDQLSFAYSFGIDANPLAVQRHPHPLHKTFETDLLFNQIVHLASKPTTALYIKNGKFNRLRKINPNFTSLFNQNHVPKDIHRNYRPTFGPIRTPIAFMHDAIMYFSASQIAELFVKSPTLEVLYASLVHPAEASFTPNSFHPDLYRYEVNGDSLTYFLEGKTDGNYTQPLHCEWLSIREIVGLVNLQVTLISSRASFHLVQISRGNVLNHTETIRYFDSPKSFLLPSPKYCTAPLYARLVPQVVYDQMFIYVRAVRTLRVTDPAGFIRTQKMKREYNWVSSAAWDYLESFSLATASLKLKLVFDFRVYKTSNWLRRLANFLAIGPHQKLYEYLGCCFLISTLALKSFLPPWFIKTITVLLLSKIGLRRLFELFATRYVTSQENFDAYLTYIHPKPFTMSYPTTVKLITELTQFFSTDFEVQETTLIDANQQPNGIRADVSQIPKTPTPLSHITSSSPPPPPLDSVVQEIKLKPSYQPPSLQIMTTTPNASNVTPDEPMLRVGQPMRELHSQYFWSESQGLTLMLPGSTPLNSPILHNCCLLTALSNLTSIDEHSLWLTLCRHFHPDELLDDDTLAYGLSDTHLELLAHVYSLNVLVVSASHTRVIGSAKTSPISLYHVGEPLDGHWSSTPPARDTVPEFRGSGFSFDSWLSDPSFPARKLSSFTPDPKRAKVLLSNLEYGHEGLLSRNLKQFKLDPDIFKIWKAKIEHTSPTAVDFILVQGFAGCGKSYPIQKKLALCDDFLVIVPTTHLRDEWKTALKLRDSSNWRVSTHETALTRRASLRILDEIYRLPPGYLDLICFLDPFITHIVCLGDPLQGEYHPTNPACTLDQLLPEALRLKPFFDLYCAWSYRIPKQMAEKFGVTPLGGDSTRPFVLKSRLPRNSLLLCASIGTASNLTLNSHRAQTAASSQGLTFSNRVGIYLDQNVRLISPQTWIVALTRSRTGIFCYGDFRILDSLPLSAFPLKLLRGTVTETLIQHYAYFLEGCDVIFQPADLQRLRGSVPKIDFSTYESDVFLDRRTSFVLSPGPTNKIDLTFAPETKRVLLQEFEEPEFSLDPITAPAHSQSAYEPVYPGADYTMFKSEFDRCVDPTTLEKRVPGGEFSNQFPFLNLPFVEEAAPPSLIAPIHNSSKDSTLLSLSISKRLRFTREKTSRISVQQEFLGNLLFQSYCSALSISPTPVPFDPILFQECISINDYAHLTSKTKNVLINTSIRSDPDWRATYVRIFTKTQHKININSIFGEWKACQTLALMHDAVVLLLGPVKKYQRAVLLRQNPNPKIFVYGGKSPSDMSNFCQNHFTYQHGVANDYTAFDQSQRGETVHFEKLKMHRVSIPEELINFHIHLKLNLTCQFGRLQPMRFTGEPGTYDDNSDFNLAILNLEFNILNHPVLISGDDSFINGYPKRRPNWLLIKPMFKHLTWKQVTSNYGEFCGYYVSKYGIVRAPKPLLVKLALSKSKSELHLTLPSYLTEFGIGHRLGDSMWLVLPPEQVLYQSALFDFFCRHAPPSLKLLLSLNEPNYDVLLNCNFNLNYSAFTMLTQKQRDLYVLNLRSLSRKVKVLCHNPQSPVFNNNGSSDSSFD